MSYILDALRKADAERERDPARGIHARPDAGRPQSAGPDARRWAWPLACGVAVLAAAYGLWGRAPQDSPPPERVAVPTVPAGLTVQAPPAAAVQASPAPAAATVLPVATSVLPPPPAPVEHMAAKVVAAPRVAPAPAAAPAAGVATPPAASVATAPAIAPATAPMPAPAPAAAPATAAPDRILAVAELPPDVQRALPKLAISGGVHSDNAAQRMLIVGGQVMTEGQDLAPGVQLEQIRARSAVLRFRGYRYSVAY